MRYQIHDLSHWLDEISAETFFEAAETRPHGLGKNPIFSELQSEIRALVPVPGTDWCHDIEVHIRPHQRDHQGQRWHSHVEWTAIFYVAVGSPVVPILVRDETCDVLIEPSPGDCVVLSPGTEHRVDDSNSDIERLSFAMLVDIGGSKYS